MIMRKKKLLSRAELSDRRFMRNVLSANGNRSMIPLAWMAIAAVSICLMVVLHFFQHGGW